MKFKVGDKVRVVDATLDYEHGFESIVTSNPNTDIYRLGGSGYCISGHKLEPITSLTFDHEKALQGSPVYHNGKQVFPVFSITEQMYGIVVGSNHYITWDKQGVNQYPYNGFLHNLTTIPPVEYVEESRWIWVSEKCAKTKEAALDLGLQDTHQLCEVKIKVKKPQ